MGVIFFVLFWLGIWVEKINQKRGIDLAYDEKITRRFNKTDPYFKFFENLFGWALALLFIYYIALG